MKQFSLEEYLKNPSKRVVTRDGRNVRIICTDFNNPDFPVIGEIKGYKWPLSFATNGETVKGRQLSCDLFFAPEKHEGWINIKKTALGYYCSSHIFQTKEDAENHEIGGNCLVVTKKVEWEE